MLNAREYPDVWVFSKEQPMPPKDYPKQDRVDAFLDTFLNSRFFDRIVIWETTWGIRKAFDLEHNKHYRIISDLEEAKQLRRKLKDTCMGDHMTALFIPKVAEEFLKCIIDKGHYGQPSEVLLGTKLSDDPLFGNPKQDIRFLESMIFESGETIFTFAHDAELLYVIER